jgi:hypothetical protein
MFMSVGSLGTLARKLLGFIGATTMKIINRTRSTSIKGVTLIFGDDILTSCTTD